MELFDGAVSAALAHAKNLDDHDALGFLWELRWKVAQTLLPFGAEPLGLVQALAQIQPFRVFKRNPDIAEELNQSLSRLISTPQNPKAAALEEVFCTAACSPVFLWHRPRDSSSPGFPPGTEDLLVHVFGAGALQLLQRRLDLPERGEYFVLTSPLHRDFPEAASKRLLSQVRWHEIHVLSYAVPLEVLEPTRTLLEPPQGLSYWTGQRMVQERNHGSPTILPRGEVAQAAPSLPLEDLQIQRWMPGNGWVEDHGGAAEPVEAVALKLQGNYVAAYATGSFVRVLNRAGRPEVAVTDLEPGDLVAVLTLGDASQTLENITEEKFGGAQALGEHRRNCLSWKVTVETCLRSVGADRLKQKFFASVGNPSAPWNDDAWSNDRLLAPKSLDGFRALIGAVHELGFFRNLSGEGRLESYISECWHGIQSLRGTRRAAGRKINVELSRHLDDLIAQQQNHWFSPGREITLPAINRSYRICEVVAVSDPLLAHPANLERLKTWQQ
ncbi:MAG: hypothetical protein J0L65_11595 [Xanthomonadales bacterium]|nr:hypothetical protein [Xanthomonadales bacterium]